MLTRRTLLYVVFVGIEITWRTILFRTLRWERVFRSQIYKSMIAVQDLSHLLVQNIIKQFANVSLQFTIVSNFSRVISPYLATHRLITTINMCHRLKIIYYCPCGNIACVRANVHSMTKQVFAPGQGHVLSVDVRGNWSCCSAWIRHEPRETVFNPAVSPEGRCPHARWFHHFH